MVELEPIWATDTDTYTQPDVDLSHKSRLYRER